MLNKSHPWYVSPKQLSEMLNVPVSWVYRQVAENKLPHIKVGKYLRFDWNDIERALKGDVDA